MASNDLCVGNADDKARHDAGLVHAIDPIQERQAARAVREKHNIVSVAQDRSMATRLHCILVAGANSLRCLCNPSKKRPNNVGLPEDR